MDRARQAEQEYRKAFLQFAEKVQLVQTLTADPHIDPRQVEAALLEMERAHVRYDICRDRWAEFFLPSEKRARVNQPVREIEHSHEHCIPTIAEFLWESAGRPEGTADEDWRKAEEIVKQAAAAVAA
jgi:hypothetical protein